MRLVQLLVRIALTIACFSPAMTAHAWSASDLRGHHPPAGRTQRASHQPPVARLIVGRTAIPATLGSYCYETGCVDMVDPRIMPHVATASVLPAETIRIVIATPRIKEFNATLTPWHGGSLVHGRSIHVRHRHIGTVATFNLGHLGRVHDQLFGVFVSFKPATPTSNPHVSGGDATYLWHLNPAGRG